jgi:flagellar biosynthesis chaperone FliJ
MAKKGIPTLIKLKKREVDDVRKALAALERQREELLLLIERMMAEMQAEAQLAADTPEIGAYFGGYAQRVKRRREEILKEVLALEGKIQQARAKLADLFGEQKRYEIVEENAKQRERKAQERKEQIKMDEVGTVQFRRTENHAGNQ